MKKLLIVACCLGSMLPAAAQHKAAVSSATVQRVLTTLAADDMQGRGTGQPGGLKAAEFLAGEFRRIGLRPLAGQADFKQTFTVYQTKPGLAKAELNGQPVDPSQVLVLSGQPTLNWVSGDAQAPALVTIGPEPAERGKLGALLNPKANTIALVDTTQRKLFGQLAEYINHGITSTEPLGAYSTVLILTSTKAAANPSYRIAASSSTGPVELRNIAGILPGHDPKRAKEYVIFSGHYDHLGTLKPTAGDSIANGADDDASGTTAVVALAEYFKKRHDNARPLIFVAFAAEEVGGYGSRYFSKQLDPKELTAMFNIEMIGKEAKFGPKTAFITGYEKSDFGKLLQANLKGTEFKFEPDPYPEQNLFYRSDNATLARLGVPAHTISTDQIPTDKLYHSVDDEVSSLDVKNMTDVISAIARSARGIVAGTQTPTRVALEK
ncbi:MAG: M20/M25/M40 family metallo-hydrolase [Cytophagaceae bacterium]|nr:MAG: M20/M25/M40 family metallo-hydrolase [Cytophagaceae bacterium]